MVVNLFNTAISLIINPSEAWKDLNKKKNRSHHSFLAEYIYPFMGLIVFTAFVGVLFSRKEMVLQLALKESILALLSLFGGFFLASCLVNEVWRRMMHREQNMKLCRQFVGYSSTLLFCLYIVLNLLPEFFFLRFLVLYTIYIVWEGVIPYMDVNESEQLKFTGITTAIIIVTPFAIEYIVGLLLPGLNN